MRLLSPLRYPGSKKRLSDYICDTLLQNNFTPSLYVEPFVGGGSVFLKLLQEDLIEKAVLIDRDPWVASFWRTVFWDTDWLLKQIEEAVVTLGEWERLKNGNPKTTRERAWTCLFLNRTSFSGILEKTAGPLGGKSQKGRYKIDCRFPRETLISRIKNISKYREKVFAILDLSWNDGLVWINNKQKKGVLPSDRVFYYFDPPFFNKASALYRYYFNNGDHRRLRDALLQLTDKWILSYDSAEEVEELYGTALRHRTNGAKKHSIETLYSASTMQERKKGKEVILSNFEYLPPLERS
ncbi:MAG: DNA adenine methylase [Gammaproteobacteria bacterium]|nr:MAG: DNA adenine methylase [Gammaproteobacteria bacterium]